MVSKLENVKARKDSGICESCNLKPHGCVLCMHRIGSKIKLKDAQAQSTATHKLDNPRKKAKSIKQSAKIHREKVATAEIRRQKRYRLDPPKTPDYSIRIGKVGSRSATLIYHGETIRHEIKQISSFDDFYFQLYQLPRIMLDKYQGNTYKPTQLIIPMRRSTTPYYLRQNDYSPKL